MKKSLFLLSALIFMFPKTQIGMKKNIKKHCLQWKESFMHYERLPNTDDNTTQMLQWERLTEVLDDNQHIPLIDEIDENDKPKPIRDESYFKYLSKDVFIIILKLLDLRDFFALLKTDSIRKALCSEQIIQQFLLEERYKNNLPKNSPIEETTIDINENNENYPAHICYAAHENRIDDQILNMLLITAASTGYTNDFHILLNTQHILNYVLEETRAYTALSAAATKGQIGIVNQLISHEVIKGQFTREELKEIIALCDNDETITRLLKRKNTKHKTLYYGKIFIGLPC